MALPEAMPIDTCGQDSVRRDQRWNLGASAEDVGRILALLHRLNRPHEDLATEQVEVGSGGIAGRTTGPEATGGEAIGPIT